MTGQKKSSLLEAKGVNCTSYTQDYMHDFNELSWVEGGIDFLGAHVSRIKMALIVSPARLLNLL